jgi:hypothetical protein
MHGAIITALTACSLLSCKQASTPTSEFGNTETRRYLVHQILLSGGNSPEQLRLYEAYQQALKESKESSDLQKFPLFRRTFELAGISFPAGTAVALSPADGHLWVRHHPETLNELEARFSMTPAVDRSVSEQPTESPNPESGHRD